MTPVVVIAIVQLLARRDYALEVRDNVRVVVGVEVSRNGKKAVAALRDRRGEFQIIVERNVANDVERLVFEIDRALVQDVALDRAGALQRAVVTNIGGGRLQGSENVQCASVDVRSTLAEIVRPPMKRAQLCRSW